MRIIIVGAGVIGTNLAQSLTAENHEVYLIELNEETARKVDEKIDAKVILGHGADPLTLKRAAVEDADIVIAVTTSDETNLVVCSLAANLGARRRIARVRKPSLNKELESVGKRLFFIDELINLEQMTAQTIVRAIETPGTRDVADFANGRILLRGFEVPATSPLCKLKIEELNNEDFPWPFLIVVIIRKGQAFIPTGQSTIEADDRIYVLLPSGSLGEFLTFVNPDVRKPQKVVIYGATDIGIRVAQSLAKNIGDLILVEESTPKAEEAAGQLEGTRIINGSATESDILTECGIEAADAFIATSPNDHSNLISAVLAKKMGAKATVIIAQQPDYMAIVDALDIDSIINPRLLAVHQILRLARGKGVYSVSKLRDCNIEALELIPEEGAAVTRAPLREIHFPPNSIVGAVCDGDAVVLAKGDTQIKPGQRVIVFCQEATIKKLQNLFVVKKG